MLSKIKQPLTLKMKDRLVRIKAKMQNELTLQRVGEKLCKKGKHLEAALHFHAANELEKAYHNYMVALRELPKMSYPFIARHLLYKLVDVYYKLHRRLPSNIRHIPQEALPYAREVISEYKRNLEYKKTVEALHEALEENSSPLIIAALAYRAAEMEKNRQLWMRYNYIGYKAGKEWIEKL
jgi:tetratricopeptide (TPR) repeat protein